MLRQSRVYIIIIILVYGYCILQTNPINCFANSSISPHIIVGNHLQQGSLHLLGGKQTNYKEVCAQQTVKMPYHIMQIEGTDVILPQMNHFFWEHELV